MAMFGELVYESSRAFADDEEEESQNQSGLSFEIEHTASGQKILDGGVPEGLGFCAFVGKVALGFGDGVIRNEKDFELLADVFMVGQGENMVDMYQRKPKRKPTARLYLGVRDKSNPTVFALFNTHGVPRYLTNELVKTLETYMKLCSRLLVFHSDTMAYYQSDETCDSKVFYVASSTYPKEDLPKLSYPLTPPNVIGGVSAAVLMFGEMYDKPALMLATYGETEIIDSISLKPFSNVIKKNKGSYLSKLFAEVEGCIEKSLKANASPVAISNLYI